MKIEKENKKNNVIFLKINCNIQIKLKDYYISAIQFFYRIYF